MQLYKESMGQLQIILVTVTQSMQTNSKLMSMEPGLQMKIFKKHRKIKRHKKLSSMSPNPVTMPTIFY